MGARVQVEFHKTHEKPIIGQVWSSWHQFGWDKDQDGQGEARNLWILDIVQQDAEGRTRIERITLPGINGN